MKRILYAFAVIWLFGVNACSALWSGVSQNNESIGATATLLSAYPQDEASITPTATMTEQEVTNACAKTIKAYAAINRCTNWNDHHQLFSKRGPYYDITPEPDGGAYCYDIESAEVVKILTVEEWWRLENTGREIPEAAKPTLPEERVFYVEISLKLRPDAPTPSSNPIFFLMWMLPEDGQCLIRTYGW